MCSFMLLWLIALIFKTLNTSVSVQIVLTEFDFNTYMPEVLVSMVTLGISEKDETILALLLIGKYLDIIINVL